eukprot:COSAG02_NODE_45635_length_355_cov_0.953125_2_plen_43_part_01
MACGPIFERMIDPEPVRAGVVAVRNKCTLLGTNVGTPAQKCCS